MSLIRKIRSRVHSKSINWYHAFTQGSKIYYLQENLRELRKANDYLMSLWLQGQSKHRNPLNAHGRKYFSQSDEDGILLEILRRIGRETGACLEVGAGDGTENNTLILATRAWKTVWIDAIPLAFDPKCNPQVLSHHQEFVGIENIVEIVRLGMSNLEVSDFNVVSIDVDGNDGHLAMALLESNLRPEVFVIEINELLPPPIRFSQTYEFGYVWDKSKNSGWSLQSLDDLLTSYGYLCIACNLQTGVNAFFVRSEFREHFQDTPRHLSDIFVGRSIHPYKYRDHRTEISPKLVEEVLRAVEPKADVERN